MTREVYPCGHKATSSLTCVKCEHADMRQVFHMSQTPERAKIKRYEAYHDEQEMRESDDWGDWVKYSDVELMLQEIEELKDKLNNPAPLDGVKPPQGSGRRRDRRECLLRRTEFLDNRIKGNQYIGIDANADKQELSALNWILKTEETYFEKHKEIWL